MNPRGWVFLLLGAGALTAAGAGCDDSGTPPGSLTGTVTDADGAPVAGARINLGYTVLLGADTLATPPLSRSLGPLTIDPTAPITVTILDHRDRVIRILASSDSTADLFWDGTDADGDPVPDGPYRYILEVRNEDGTQTFEKWLILIRSSLETRAMTAVTTSGDDGSFTIPYPEIPIWEGYPVAVAGSSPDSILAGDAVFDNTFQAYAFPGDGSTVHAQETVHVENRYKSVHVNLVLP